MTGEYSHVASARPFEPFDQYAAEVRARAELLEAAAVPAGSDPLGTVVPDDVSSLLAIAHRDGVTARAELRHLGYQLLVAGHESTTLDASELSSRSQH